MYYFFLFNFSNRLRAALFNKKYSLKVYDMVVLYIVGGLVVLLLILALVAPKDFAVSREIVVSKDQEFVFNSLRSIKEQTKWSPWSTRDPNMKSEFRGTDGEVGSVNYWLGNKDVGEGEQEITKLTPSSSVETELRFLKPWKATNKAYFTIEEVGTGTKVTWGFSGSNKIPMNIMMLFMNMDKVIGKDFEEGLVSFKKYIEAK